MLIKGATGTFAKSEITISNSFNSDRSSPRQLYYLTFADILWDRSFSYRFPGEKVQIKQTLHHQERLPAHHEELAGARL